MEKALKVAERQAAVSLSKQQTKRSLSSIRKPHWFEKFNWFITSDNYLVVRSVKQSRGGRSVREGRMRERTQIEKAEACG